MANKNFKEDEELLKAQAHVWNQTFNFINSGSLKCAVELGIPDIIHSYGKPMPLSNLISALAINPSKAGCVRRLMRVLAHSGFFLRQKMSKAKEEDEESYGYSLTPSSRLLLKDEPLSVRPLLLAGLDPVLTKPWHFLSGWLEDTGDDDSAAFDMAHGMGFWEYNEKDPRLGVVFNEAMASDSRLVTKVLVNECRYVFEGLTSLVDVGGGTGSVARAIAGMLPRMKCTVLDLPPVVAGLKGTENLDFVAGDMFVEVPKANAVLLKWILHDWNDEDCVKILKKCKEAIPSKENGGKIIIIDMTMENQKQDDESIEAQLFFDMMMMVLFSSKERNEKEWKKLFVGAGLSSYKITPVLGLRSIIEVYP